MFGDDAAALLAGFYEVDQVKSCTKFEAAGLNFALPSFVHFDLDGHCANNLMRQRGSARLIPRSSCRSRTAGFTRRGCAKHACTALYTNNSLDGFYNCSTFLQTSVHFLRLVRATAEGVRRYMDAPTGNMSPNSEAEGLCRETRDYSISNWNASDDATMRTGAWRSDEEHEPLPHRHGEEAQRRERKHWGRKLYVEIWDQFLGIFLKASFTTTESHGPSLTCTTVHHVVTGLITQRCALELVN